MKIKRVYFCFSGLKMHSAGSDLSRPPDLLKKKKNPQINESKMLRYLRPLKKNSNLYANIFIKSILFEAEDLKCHRIHHTGLSTPHTTARWVGLPLKLGLQHLAASRCLAFPGLRLQLSPGAPPGPGGGEGVEAVPSEHPISSGAGRWR